MKYRAKQWSGAAIGLLLASLPGCWMVVGVQNRTSTTPFVETVSAECLSCVDASCSAELTACVDSKSCALWPAAPDPSGVMPPEALALKTCMRHNCFAGCYDPFEQSDPLLASLPSPFHNPPPPGPVVENSLCVPPGMNKGNVFCNPVKNAPCDTAHGEACSLDLNTDKTTYEHTARFSCRATAHVLKPGQDCGPIEGQCEPGSDCFNGTCYRYCCSDCDCDPSSQSQCWPILTYYNLSLGVCTVRPGNCVQP